MLCVLDGKPFAASWKTYGPLWEALPKHGMSGYKEAVGTPAADEQPVWSRDDTNIFGAKCEVYTRDILSVMNVWHTVTRDKSQYVQGGADLPITGPEVTDPNGKKVAMKSEAVEVKGSLVHKRPKHRGQAMWVDAKNIQPHKSTFVGFCLAHFGGVDLFFVPTAWACDLENHLLVSNEAMNVPGVRRLSKSIAIIGEDREADERAVLVLLRMMASYEQVRSGVNRTYAARSLPNTATRPIVPLAGVLRC